MSDAVVKCEHLDCSVLRCIKCDDIKWSCEVYKSSIRKSKQACVCKPCHKNANRNWRMRNGNGQVRNWQNRGLDFTLDDYDLLYKRQEGKCAICSATQSVEGRELSVDHNHKTGEVRGLLCFNCNTILGKVKDDPLLLMKAALYLQGEGGLQ